jgi:DNA-binding CsgD family transcriptional regulator
MSEALKLNDISPKELEQLQCFNIVGDFRIEDDYFLIICPREHPEENSESTLYFSPNALYQSKVGKFEVDGQFYTVIKAKNPLESIEPNLTTLLTERELQIAAFVALGWSNKQVAKQLCISEWTVGTHLRRIFIKIGVDSRAAMTYRCASLIHKLHQLGKIPHRTSTGERFSRPYIHPD